MSSVTKRSSLSYHSCQVSSSLEKRNSMATPPKAQLLMLLQLHKLCRGFKRLLCEYACEKTLVLQLPVVKAVWTSTLEDVNVYF